MGERGVHQRRQGVVIQEPLSGIKADNEFRRRWWDEGGVVQRASGRPDPVLAAPKLPRRSHVAPNAPHEKFVHLAHQAQRHGQRGQAFQAVLQSGYVVAHLSQVGRASLHCCSSFSGQQLSQSRLGPLNAAGKHGLFTDKGPDQKVRIGQAPPFARKPAYSPVGVRRLTVSPSSHARAAEARLAHRPDIHRDSSPDGHEADMLAQTQMSRCSLLAEVRIAETLIISLAPFRKQARSVFFTNSQLKTRLAFLLTGHGSRA